MPREPCERGVGSNRSTRAMFAFGSRSNFKVAHEPAGGEPEIVADHHDGLEMLAVAMPQGGDQLGVGLGPVDEQPLLELVENEQRPSGRPGAISPAEAPPTRR